MLPMNLLSKNQTADYLVTGVWSQKAVAEARLFGNVHTACSSEDRNFCYIPKTCQCSGSAEYVHFTSNNTIFGTEFQAEPNVSGDKLICDAAAIFQPADRRQQICDDLCRGTKEPRPQRCDAGDHPRRLGKGREKRDSTMLQYRTHADEHSLYNTPPTFGIYVMG